MADFELFLDGKCAAFVLEGTAYSGVVKIAEKVCKDVELVTGARPELIAMGAGSGETGRSVAGESSSAASGTGKGATSVCEKLEELCANGVKYAVVPATLGRSDFLAELEKAGKIDLAAIRGKRECYSFRIVTWTMDAVASEATGAGAATGANAAVGTESAAMTLLVIAGSDKRGTIYGLFHISELMGVSPWVTFADVVPEKRKSVIFTEKDQTVSKEPSVKYRGFFINDEWPAFGNWTVEHFGGFTAKMYDMIFETLLRLKGNYLWPAMWSSSFSLDGPGEASAALADEYGVVMSNSHHEPCLRHSEEWDMVRGEDSQYGNAWNYYTNREGLLRYWRDGLLRSGKYENIITIGMRGERDSSMLGPDASLKQNIDLLKDIITEQRKLINECVDANGREIPQMLALYKEVEAYFYGNEGAHDGLRDWDGLAGVTFMLCEDNFGNMRTLPTADLADRDGGWGMYYHFDYHGGPVSYEWVNSSYLPKVWDQMTKAYEFGIRDIWVVNVGDLKFNEYPLSFFMDLAYDYEKWGVSNLNAPAEYLKNWVNREFGNCLEKSGRFMSENSRKPGILPEQEPGTDISAEDDRSKLVRIMETYTWLGHNRKPESMRPDIYHPVHEREADRMLSVIAETEQQLDQIKAKIPKEAEASFWELVYYPAMGTLNVQKWNIYAGLNAFYAGLGAVAANGYADGMKACLECDRKLTEKFHGLLGGKWNGMALSKHVGFTAWNDEGCRYPQRIYVDPAPGTRLLAFSEGDGDTITAGGDWTGKVIKMRQFLDPNVEEANLVLLNAGAKTPEYDAISEVPWVSFVWACGDTERLSGEVEQKEMLCVHLDRERWKEAITVASAVENTTGRNGSAAGASAGTVVSEMALAWGEWLNKPYDFVVKYAGGNIKVKLEIADFPKHVAHSLSEKAGTHANVSGKNEEEKRCTFLECGGIVSIEAKHFGDKISTADGHFELLDGYGRTRSGMKAFPVNRTFTPENAPAVSYRIQLEKEGNFDLQVYAAPVNPHEAGKDVTFGVSVNGTAPVSVSLIPENYAAGENYCGSWCEMALSQIRIVHTPVTLKAGINELKFLAIDPGFILEKLVLVREGVTVPKTYLGPMETASC